MHWRKDDELHQTVAAYILMAIGRPRKTVEKKAVVRIQIFRPVRRFDNDNCVPARKFILDALNRLGWLKNDSPVWCESHDLPCVLAKEPRVQVTLDYIA
jgi:Holliday junction resolvase RusA-like endonuclease